jgi:hypothetical protein
MRSSRRSSGPSYCSSWKFKGNDTSYTIACKSGFKARAKGRRSDRRWPG